MLAHLRSVFVGIFISFVLVSCTSEINESTQNTNMNGTVAKPLATESGSYLPRSVESEGKRQQKFFLPIVMYHYVEEVKDKNDKGRINLSVHPKTFEGELKSLQAAGYTSYFVRDIPELFAGTMKLEKKSISLTFDDGYEDFYTDVYPLLKKYHMRGTLYVINDRVNTPDYVTLDQLKEMMQSGLVEIGGHTLDHKNLQYASQKVATEQIVESKKRLEKDLGITLESFAYPYGGFQPKVTEKIVKDAGYKVAVSVDKGTFHTSEKLFTLYRLRAGMFTPENIVGSLQMLERGGK